MAERFWAKVDRRGPDDCWPWLASKDRGGRGDFYANGRKQKAPRIAWMLEHGRPVPPELDACHSCDNPSCVNPAHIWPGTARDNTLDALRKGRLRFPYQDPNHRPWQNDLTHCRRGHEFTPDNTYLERGKWRRCQTCQRLNRKKYRDARRSPKSSILTPPEGPTDNGPWDPDPTCPTCQGTGRASNAQFTCACRWNRRRPASPEGPQQREDQEDDVLSRQSAPSPLTPTGSPRWPQKGSA